MRQKIRRGGLGSYSWDWAKDTFVHLEDDDLLGSNGSDVIVSFARFQSDGIAWLAEGRRVGVRRKSDEPVEQLACALPRLAAVALEFPKFRDGRAYSSAALLRTCYGYKGELRAVGRGAADRTGPLWV